MIKLEEGALTLRTSSRTSFEIYGVKDGMVKVRASRHSIKEAGREGKEGKEGGQMGEGRRKREEEGIRIFLCPWDCNMEYLVWEGEDGRKVDLLEMGCYSTESQGKSLLLFLSEDFALNYFDEGGLLTIKAWHIPGADESLLRRK